jgi:hypothetical protein
VLSSQANNLLSDHRPRVDTHGADCRVRLCTVGKSPTHNVYGTHGGVIPLSDTPCRQSPVQKTRKQGPPTQLRRGKHHRFVNGTPTAPIRGHFCMTTRPWQHAGSAVFKQRRARSIQIRGRPAREGTRSSPMLWEDLYRRICMRGTGALSPRRTDHAPRYAYSVSGIVPPSTARTASTE